MRQEHLNTFGLAGKGDVKKTSSNLPGVKNFPPGSPSSIVQPEGISTETIGVLVCFSSESTVSNGALGSP